MNKIYSVCWNITEKCNENCEFCYRTIVNDLSLSENKIIADKLINHGVEKITFAGGEPLLYNDLFKLAKYIKLKKPNILLSITTNGLLINSEKYSKILQFFDWITFDLESSKSDYHKSVGRGEFHLQKNLENLKLFDGKINIKINTVATKQNICDIPLIWEVIKKFDVQRWKIFRYYPITFMAKQNKNKFSITNEEFKNLSEKISLLTISSNVQVDYNDYDDFLTTYFSIFPNGTLKDNTGNVTCNILTDSLDECINSINLSNHITRRRIYKKFLKNQ